MDRYEHFRQFISNFLQGENIEALLGALADGSAFVQNTSVAVNDQLTISTSVGEFLDRRLAEIGVVRPPELGISDQAARRIGISTNAAKQITEVLHTILDTFYGADNTRANVTSGLQEPYNLTNGMDLVVRFEDESDVSIVFREEDFENITQATAKEVVNAINRTLKAEGRNSFAAEFVDFDTDNRYVKLYGAAKGPYSLVQVVGGESQVFFEFPTMRDTVLTPLNTTTWMITKHSGNVIRFRWDSGPKPKLESVLIGDRVLVYGAGFLSADDALVGTFVVTNVRPPQNAPSFDSGWFELETEVPDLKNSTPDIAPPVNSPGITYSYTVNQSAYNDLKFFLARKNTPYSPLQYAMAFEPAPSLLRVYIGATTRVVQRELEGASHLHLRFQDTDFDGTYGSTSDDDLKIEVLSDYSLKYKDSALDNNGVGGTISYSGPVTKTISSIWRENGYTYITTTEPHGISGDIQWNNADDYTAGTEVWHLGQIWLALQDSGPGFGGSKEPGYNAPYWQHERAGVNLSSELIDVDAGTVLADDPNNPFLGPYMYDLETNYTLRSERAALREPIVQGDVKRTLVITGTMPNEEGILLFDLNKDNQEGPVRYFASQPQTGSVAVNIQSISRNGNKVTVVTDDIHGAIPGSQVTIAGTVNFNGTWVVDSISSSNAYTFTHPVSAVTLESVGTSTTQLTEAISTLTLDSSYEFKYDHSLSGDVDLLSDNKAHDPALDGSDFATYITDTAQARQYCQNLIESITALGINMEIIVVYPSDVGLGNQGGSDNTDDPPASDKVYVWESTAQ